MARESSGVPSIYCRRCRTPSIPATRRAGSTAACTLNPLYWPARHEETLLTTAIYKFHPDFAGKVRVWWGDPEQNYGLATLEGGDVHADRQRQRPDRHERADLAPGDHPTGRRVVQQRRRGARHRRRHAQAAAAMHLDTVFTFCDRDVVMFIRRSSIDPYVLIWPGDRSNGNRSDARKQAVRRRRRRSSRTQEAPRR